MKKYTQASLSLFLLWSCALFYHVPVAFAETAINYNAVPPFTTTGAPPLVMMVMGRDHKLYYEAYNDASDLDEDGTLDVGYRGEKEPFTDSNANGVWDTGETYTDVNGNGLWTDGIDYYGYFDSYKCYEYDSGQSRFEPTSITANKKCSGKWSGDYLNYLTTSRMDALRKVLYGGMRSTDATGETVLQRAYVPQDAHTWGKEYESVVRDHYDIREYTPLSLPNSGTRHLFASTALSDNGVPLLRVLPNNFHRIWEWVAKERPVADTSLQTAGGSYTSYPANHTDYNTLVTQFANATHQQGTGAPSNGRIDGSGNPYGPDDYYLNIFKGNITVTTAGTYQFAVDGDDAVEVIIDGTVVAGWYGGHGSCGCTTYNGSITLTSGSHSVEFRHQEAAGGDNYYLRWYGADSGNTWVIVPTAKFSGLIQTTYDVLLPSSMITDYQVKTQVCLPGMPETNCKLYPDGNYKPVGLLQRHGEAESMYFGLMSGSYAKNISGGVLRKNIGSIKDEINATTGQFLATNGILKTFNTLRIVDFDYGGYSYNNNCGWITTRPINEGECQMWGNPIGEMMYETLRYFAGKTAASTGFLYAAGSRDDTLGLAKPPWINPYLKEDVDGDKVLDSGEDTNANGTLDGFDYCSKPIMLVLSDINPSYDSNQLPGSYFDTTFAGDITGLNVNALAGTISTNEGFASGSRDHFIGQQGTEFDGACTAKDVGDLAVSRGLCPEEPTKQGSYYSASAAYFGNKEDVNSTATGDQNVTTYVVGLASPLPKINIDVAGTTVTLVPFGKSVGGSSISAAQGGFQPTNTIVDFFVEQITPTYGKFRINYEDVEQGADHDMDAIVEYEYTVHGDTVDIKLNSSYAAGGIIQHMGYIISGTTQDGIYLEVRDFDTASTSDPDYFLDTPPGMTPDGLCQQATQACQYEDATALPLITTRTFTKGSVGGATLLNNPLYYAAKWGGFEDSNDNNLPDLHSEWDKDNDGVPDTYFYVVNPLKLEEQLNKTFAEILRRTSSGTAASVISGSRSGEGAIYQSVFYPEYSDNANNKISWAGSVHASFVDDLGRMREDTNQNRILDENDKIIIFRNQTDGTLVIDKYGLVGAIAEKTNITLPAAASLAGTYFLLNSVGEEFYVWFTVDGSGTDPLLLHGISGIKVALFSTDTADSVATKTRTAIDAYGAFAVPAPAANTITITNTIPGTVIDATTPPTSGITIAVTQQGVGETTHLDFTGNAEDIQYLWNSNTWLNSISDANIVTQRTYATTSQQRYIFTFIDADQDKIADSGEQLEFSATTLPTLTDLTNAATIYPYIPVNSDSETLPASPSLTVNLTEPVAPALPVGNRNEFLQKQTQRVINYTRGLDQGSTTLTTGTGGTIPAFRSRKLDLDNNGSLETTWRLGDIVHSSPTVVNKPREALHLLYKDSTYATFAAQYSNRRTVLYSGANDGMLHAFNGGFYEDRFDIFPGAIVPAVPDGIKDVEYGLQPKDSSGATIAGFTAHTLGAELWAYVPYNLLPHLYWPTELNYAHVYYTDLKPRIFDAKIFTPDTDHPGGWGTVLVGGMRFGGGKINVDINKTDGNVNTNDRTMSSAYYILDITNPEVPPTVLGEISFPHLGYTTCYPTVATMKDKVEVAGSPNRWFLIFGSGPAEADGSAGRNTGASLPVEESLPKAISNQKAKIYVVGLVEMAKNKVLKTLDTSGTLTEIIPPVPPALPQPGYYQSFDNDNNAFISDPITVDYDLDYKADAVYFGTESYNATAAAGTEWGGKLRRIVINDDITPAFWDGDSTLIDLEKSAADPIVGSYQPITAAPSVGLDPDGNNWVFFGTGRYFIRDDKNITTPQTFYGIKEPQVVVAGSPVNSYAEVFRAGMYNSTSIEVNTATRLVSGGTAPNTWTNEPWASFLTDTKAFDGWYYNFTTSLERNVGQAALFGDLTTFTSYIPSNDICTYEGSSYLYALYYLTGTAPSRQVIRDSLFPNPTNHLKRISLGAGLVSKPSIHVGRKEGSTIFVQTSEGAILTLDEENPGQTKSGRSSWGYRE